MHDQHNVDVSDTAIRAPVQVGEGEFLDRWDPSRPLAQRQAFVRRVLRHVLQARISSGLFCQLRLVRPDQDALTYPADKRVSMVNIWVFEMQWVP